MAAAGTARVGKRCEYADASMVLPSCLGIAKRKTRGPAGGSTTPPLDHRAQGAMVGSGATQTHARTAMDRRLTSARSHQTWNAPAYPVLSPTASCAGLTRLKLLIPGPGDRSAHAARPEKTTSYTRFARAVLPSSSGLPRAKLTQMRRSLSGGTDHVPGAPEHLPGPRATKATGSLL